MPTSSIFTPVKLETKEQVERFLDAWDKAEANIGKYSGNNVHILTPEEAKERVERFLKERGLKSEEKDDVNV